MIAVAPKQPRRLVLGAITLICALLLALASAAGSLAAEAPAVPHWHLESRAAPTNLPLEGEGAIVVTAANLGDGPAKGETGNPIKIIDTLPNGMEAIGEVLPAGDFGGTPRFTGGGTEVANFNCTIKVRVVECTFPHLLYPFEQLQFLIRVKTKYASAGPQQNELSVQEGGATSPAAQVTPALSVSNEAPQFGIEPGGFQMTPESEEFQPENLSGGHPFQLTTTVDFNQGFAPNTPTRPTLPTAAGLAKNLSFKLPPGLLGNPTTVPQCTDAQFGVHEENNINACPEATVVGVADISYNNASISTLEFASQAVPIFNLEPGAGEPARFGFEIFHVPIILNTSVRTGGDYGATISVVNASDVVQVLGTRVTIWGSPGDPRHDNARGWPCLGKGSYTSFILPTPPHCGDHALHNQKAFLTLPTSCGPQESSAEGESWSGAVLPKVTSTFNLSGCGELPFSPSFEFQTEKHTASTPTGLNAEVNLPQESTVTMGSRAEADIKTLTLELPDGVQTSAGAANGLVACGVSESGFGGENGDTGSLLSAELEAQAFKFLQPPERDLGQEPSCPQAAKLGTVLINTPFLEKPLTGSLYLATQDTNPFAPRLVAYLIAEEPQTKVLIKLAGEVEILPSGRLISRFKKTPQAAFEHLKLHLFNGSSTGAETASQATPSRCSSTAYSVKAAFGTWSEAPGEPEPVVNGQSNPEGMAVTSGPHGSPCTQIGQNLPFAPSFQAGATNPEAGKFSPFTVTLARPDGNQALKSLNVALPPGAAARLASVTQCGEPAAAQGTCGPESLIGESTTYSGLGNAPIALPGKVYLTGPYGGAPFGLSTVTPAEKVGPFNIGRIVVRSKITVDRNTAAASIDTEATSVFPAGGGAVENYAGLPEIIKGLPAQVKQLNVTVNRPEFQFNPTNCEAMAVGASTTGHEGGSANLSSPYKVSNCAALAFAPKLTATVGGQASKAEGASLTVKVQSAGLGQANIHKVDLTLPLQLPSRLTTIQKACVLGVFEANPASCPEGSNIGFAIIHTPVLKNPLTGPAYLVSHGGAAFPDVEFVLQGEGITLLLDGKTDIKKGITYSRFESAPDAPFTTFETVLPTGPHSALTAFVPESKHYSLCGSGLTMPTEIVAQNGAVIKQTTSIIPTGCGGVAAFKATRAQKLAKALKACKKLKKKSKRVACEKKARKLYGAKKAAKKTTKKASAKKH